MKLAIIGGSLLKHIKNFSVEREEQINTTYGLPSDMIRTGKINDVEIIYLNRHGCSHHIAPHQINYKANLFVLKLLDVTHILAVTAVGGITEKMSPMKWVVSDQLIDYSHGRVQTYNDSNDQAVNHIDFSYPFDDMLSDKLKSTLNQLDCEFEPQATYGVTQGPRLETVAEIKRMHRDGCDIVGMTVMPEASLARELDIRYANLSLVVNWAAGAGPEAKPPKIITMEEIKNRITEGNVVGENIIQAFVEQL
jgi:5'-methylthioinosine phosphorylase